MKYYIIAGEASGDLHASNLIKQIKILDSGAEFRAWGGDLMQKEGATVVKHYRELAFMGFVEVIANLKTILKNIDFCKADILEFQPDQIILVDYPGFNLRIAQFASQAGLRVTYYISPQVWAWNQSRVHKIKRFVGRMLVILPFEKEFFKKFDFDVDFVGHPLLDAIGSRNVQNKLAWRNKHDFKDQKIIALLPGSRKQEIKTMLPLMLSVKEKFNDYVFVVAGAPSVDAEFYKSLVSGSNVKVVYDSTYDLLENATAALVTSGTATLETALFNVPEVVCYKGNRISYHIARRLVKVKYISLVNLIMDREVVKELIQTELNSNTIYKELSSLINDSEKRSIMLADFSALRDKLGGAGASARAAELIVGDNSNIAKN